MRLTGTRRLTSLAMLAVGMSAAVVGGVTSPRVVVRASSHADRDAGAALFHGKGCEHCHGAGLLGTERGPALVGVGRKLTADGIRHQIMAGGGGMPAFGEVLGPDEISRLADYLAAQKKRVKSRQAEPAGPQPKLPANGSDDQS